MIHIIIGEKSELRRWGQRIQKNGYALQHIAVNVGERYQVRLVWGELRPKNSRAREELMARINANFEEAEKAIPEYGYADDREPAGEEERGRIERFEARRQRLRDLEKKRAGH